MINEEEQNIINKGLAIAYAMNLLMTIGRKEVMKAIDANDDPEIRIYFRSLVQTALEIMKEEDVPVKE